MKSYAIATPGMAPASAGISGIHQMNADLLAYGCDSRLILRGESVTDSEIVVYPDHTFDGNPSGANNVVRMLFMYAGYFGKWKDYPPEEYMYYYSPDFVFEGREPDNILTVPMINERRFPFIPQEDREGSCYLAVKFQDFFGKKPFDLPNGCIRITKQMDLPELFSRIKTLVSFDNSAINIEAMMAGIDVRYRFNEHFEKPFRLSETFDLNNVRESYRELKRIYYEEQLPSFIKRTQEHFK